jgi:hypothetical protein
MVTNLGKFFTDSINYVDQSFTDFDFIVLTIVRHLQLDTQ